jgi:hypothetical protein
MQSMLSPTAPMSMCTWYNIMWPCGRSAVLSVNWPQLYSWTIAELALNSNHLLIHSRGTLVHVRLLMRSVHFSSFKVFLQTSHSFILLHLCCFLFTNWYLLCSLLLVGCLCFTGFVLFTFIWPLVFCLDALSLPQFSQYNVEQHGQTKKGKRTNGDLQQIHIKLKIE